MNRKGKKGNKEKGKWGNNGDGKEGNGKLDEQGKRTGKERKREQNEIHIFSYFKIF